MTDLSTQVVVMTTNGGEGSETSVEVALRFVRVPLHVDSFSCFVWFICTLSLSPRPCRVRPQNSKEQIDMCQICTFCTPGRTHPQSLINNSVEHYLIVCSEKARFFSSYTLCNSPLSHPVSCRPASDSVGEGQGLHVRLCV